MIVKYFGVEFDDTFTYDISDVKNKIISSNESNYLKLKNYFENYYNNANNDIKKEIINNFLFSDYDYIEDSDKPVIERNSFQYLYFPYFGYDKFNYDINFKFSIGHFLCHNIEHDLEEFGANGYSDLFVEKTISSFEESIARYLKYKDVMRLYVVDMFNKKLDINDICIYSIQGDTDNILILVKIINVYPYSEDKLLIEDLTDNEQFYINFENNKSSSLLKLNDSYKSDIVLYLLKEK